MSDPNARLERRYRRLLHLYPRSYRAQHGEDMIGVLMTDSEQEASRPRVAAALDLIRGAILVHTRYWWEMRAAAEHERLAIRHPLLVIRIRCAVAIWLCFVTAVLCARGHWWGLTILLFVAIHLVLAGRTAARHRAR